MASSFTDAQLAYRARVIAGLKACHDGTLRIITIHQQRIDDALPLSEIQLLLLTNQLGILSALAEIMEGETRRIVKRG